MSCHFLRDCGLEGNKDLDKDLDTIRLEYFSNKGTDLQEGLDGDTYTTCSETDSDPEDTTTNPLSQSNEICTETSQQDEDFQSNITSFLQGSCGCDNGKNRVSCNKQFGYDEMLDQRSQCAELTSTELDLVILGALQSQIKRSYKKRQRITYFYQGLQVCKKTFMFLYGIGKHRLEHLKTHLRRNGITPRRHGNTSRLPHNVLQHDTVSNVVTFIKNFAAEQGVSLPGRVPHYKNLKVQLLPSCESKASVWRRYKMCTEANNQSCVGYTKFVSLWNTLTPYVLIMTPATDLCHTCQLNNTKISQGINVSDEEKTHLIQKQQQHLKSATSERASMKECIASCKKTLKNNTTIDLLSSRPSCSFNGTVHYSYDYAQQVHIPSNPQQPGPIYFKTPRKCGLFGICCEGLPRQVNYLIDEAVHTGKGANSTISYVHDFFSNHGAGETDVQIHADNCGGQNKNNYVIWYYCWRVLCGLHHSILYSFLIAGHTKFSPDWCFGLLKQSFRRRYVSSLFDLLEAVDKSTVSGVNIAKLCGLHDGTVLVHVYDWVTFLENYFKKIPGISKFHHFRFSKEHPGVVFCRNFVDSEEIEFQILKNTKIKPPYQLPSLVIPKNLDQERKKYLFREIREFCRPGTEDLVAPALPP